MNSVNILKGLVYISQLNLNYTSEMEKAMQKSHGMGYAEYSRKLELRIDVEKQREKDYRKGREVLQAVSGNLNL